MPIQPALGSTRFGRSQSCIGNDSGGKNESRRRTRNLVEPYGKYVTVSQASFRDVAESL